METSTAVPSRTEVVERGLTELADDDIEHLADLMVRSWVRVNRLSLGMVLLPFGGCAALIGVGGAALLNLGMVFGAVTLFGGVFVQAIASALFRRSLALEVESLGYGAAVGRAAGAAWVRALRSFLPRFTRAQKRRACVKELVRARERAQRTS
ncbi:MAG: hypothetical protein IT383_23730 [Deltaproteobacteria bacterium]|nr:hypothetical protein [Deltaproteobacteria bacterium]